MTKTTRILVVDDDPEILSVLTLILNTAGYDVLKASSGRQGLQLARTERPDLALLDVVLGRVRKEYTDSGRDELFVGLKDTLTGGRSEIPYSELAARLGLSEGAVKVAAHRLRQRYRDLLRVEIASTVAGPEEVEEELKHLFAALSA